MAVRHGEVALRETAASGARVAWLDRRDKSALLKTVLACLEEKHVLPNGC